MGQHATKVADESSIIRFTALADYSAGEVVVLNSSMIVVVMCDTLSGDETAGEIDGIFDFVKDASVIADGARVYWSDDSQPVNPIDTGTTGAASGASSGNYFLGRAIGAVESGDETVRVLRIPID